MEREGEIEREGKKCANKYSNIHCLNSEWRMELQAFCLFSIERGTNEKKKEKKITTKNK